MYAPREQLVESFIAFDHLPARTAPECRICLEGGEGLLAPCSCAGSVAYVHFACLREWISKHHRVRLDEAPALDYFSCEMCKSRISFEIRKSVQCLPRAECARNCCAHRLMLGVLLVVSVGFLALFVFGVLMVVRSGVMTSMGGAWFEVLLIFCSLLIVLIVQILSTYLLMVKFLVQRTAIIVAIAGVAEGGTQKKPSKHAEQFRKGRQLRKGSEESSPGRSRSPDGRSRSQSTCFSQGNLLTIEGRTKTNENQIIPLDIVMEEIP